MFKIEKGYDAVSKTFRLPVDLVNTLEKLAAENKISLNRLVIQCLQYSIDNLDDSSEDSSQNMFDIKNSKE